MNTYIASANDITEKQLHDLVATAKQYNHIHDGRTFREWCQSDGNNDEFVEYIEHNFDIEFQCMNIVEAYHQWYSFLLKANVTDIPIENTRLEQEY